MLALADNGRSFCRPSNASMPPRGIVLHLSAEINIASAGRGATLAANGER